MNNDLVKRMMDKQIELMDTAQKHKGNIPAEVYDAILAAGTALASLLVEAIVAAAEKK